MTGEWIKKKKKKGAQIHPEAPFLLSHSPKEEKKSVHFTAARRNHSCTITHVAALLNHGLHKELQGPGEY